MNSGLQDILPPPLAPEGVGMVALVSALSLLLLCVALLRYYRAPRNHARRSVKRLRNTVNRGDVDTRTAAHTLARSLREGLASDFSREAEWSAFSLRLAEARFSLQSCSVNECDALLQEALVWLERTR